MALSILKLPKGQESSISKYQQGHEKDQKHTRNGQWKLKFQLAVMIVRMREVVEDNSIY